MKHITPFRVAAALLLLFCAAHTGGGMLSQESLGPASDAVFEQMQSVHFAFNGSDCTWYGFWFGFGMMFSGFLLFSALVAWQLDRVPPVAWPAVSVIAWALIAVHAVTTFLSWRYFFIGPAVFGVLITALLTWGTIRMPSRGAEPR